MKNQVCVYIFHQSMGSHVLMRPAGLAGRAFRKISGELELVRGASHPSGIDIWWPFLQSAPPEGGPDLPLPWTSAGKRTPAGCLPTASGFETRIYFEKANVWTTISVWPVNLWTHTRDFPREKASKVINKNAILSMLTEMKSGKRERGWHLLGTYCVPGARLTF